MYNIMNQYIYIYNIHQHGNFSTEMMINQQTLRTLRPSDFFSGLLRLLASQRLLWLLLGVTT